MQERMIMQFANTPGKAVLRLIHNELANVATVRQRAKPREADKRIDGWGTIGKSNQLIHYKTAILQTIDIIGAIMIIRSCYMPPKF
jgi:hypothetical protein